VMWSTRSPARPGLSSATSSHHQSRSTGLDNSSVSEGTAVSAGALRPGDLLFTRGTAAVPEHVGMFIGGGLVVQAPKTGDVVKVSPLAEWSPQILAARRIV
ncbi:NlpC/P60 family protein, partial [Kitasatospora sp. NPDC050463]|uniref:C40 family peptidase n=1 Tax=Kitasatospora sp. NPDC050463 TaxID=3155786 RepID=UPI0033CC8960